MRWLVAALLCLASFAAHAKPTRQVTPAPEFNGDRWVRVAQPGTTARDITRAMCGAPPLGCGTAAKAKHKPVQARKGQRRPVPLPRPRPVEAGQQASSPNLFRAFSEEIAKALPSRSLAGVVAPLAAKAREIVASCGSKVISGVRHTYVRGTGGRLSLHASGRAVDIQGAPACIYSHLRGWPGGYSIDYGRVNHVHVSYAPGGAEWRARFNHYRGGKRKRHRYARRRA